MKVRGEVIVAMGLAGQHPVTGSISKARVNAIIAEHGLDKMTRDEIRDYAVKHGVSTDWYDHEFPDVSPSLMQRMRYLRAK